MWLSVIAISVLTVPTPKEAEALRFKNAFERGEGQFQKGEYSAAIASFREADTARVTPEVAYDLAKCFEKLRDEPYAVFYYRLYLRRAPSAPDTLDIAARIAATLAKAEQEGQGFLEFEAPGAKAVTVLGQRSELPLARFLPPGDFEVTAEFPGGSKTTSVQIHTGKTTSVILEPLLPAAPAERDLTAELLTKAADSSHSSGPSPLRIGSFVVFGAGLAALAAGIALGVASRADAALVMDPNRVFAEREAFEKAARGKAIGANILYGVGGAAVAGGALMFVFSMPEPGLKPVSRTP